MREIFSAIAAAKLECGPCFLLGLLQPIDLQPFITKGSLRAALKFERKGG